MQLFAGPLAELRFPDIDGELLMASSARVHEQRGTLQQALEAVVEARAVLEAGERELLDLAKKAHAYATVFASADEDLREELAAIRFDARRLAPKKRRGRPRKRSASDEAGAEPVETGKRQTSLTVADSDAA